MLRISMTTAAVILSTPPCLADEQSGRAFNGPVEIAYWVQGPKDGVPLVLVNGQGAATRIGDDALVDAFVDRGFRVITFDNRDTGQSSILRSAGAPPEMADIMAALSAGSTPPIAYDLSDMAGDAIAVLDASGIDRAHFLGHSLGGMIVQMVAAEHPGRVLSMISASSTSGEPDLPFGPALAAISEPMPESDMTALDMQVAIYRIFEGDAQYRMSDGEIIARVKADMAADDPNAAARQGAAAMASGDRRGLLATITVPALVLHGSDDPWFTIDHAQSTANALGAPMQMIEGMGHIISDAAAEPVADRVTAFVDRLPTQ